MASWFDSITAGIKPLFVDAKTYRNPELEARIGNFITNENGTERFKAGVVEVSFEYFLNKMQTANPDNWTNKPLWYRVEEQIFYKDIRYRRRDNLPGEFIRKIPIRGYDAKLTGSRNDIRFSLNLEETSTIKPCKPRWIRFKERIEFEYKGLFRYDFTVVWEGKDKEEALNARPKFEIEIECIKVQHEDTDYLIKSILLKCSEFLSKKGSVSIHNQDIRDYSSNHDTRRRYRRDHPNQQNSRYDNNRQGRDGCNQNERRKRRHDGGNQIDMNREVKYKPQETKLDENFLRGVDELYKTICENTNNTSLIKRLEQSGVDVYEPYVPEMPSSILAYDPVEESVKEQTYLPKFNCDTPLDTSNSAEPSLKRSSVNNDPVFVRPKSTKKFSGFKL
jgi:hypothetical protein